MASESSLARLEREGKLRRQAADLDYLRDLLAAARRNFVAGRLLLDKADEAAFKLYYDGLLQVSRAVLLFRGYRPDDGEQHRTTFLAAGEILGPREFWSQVREHLKRENPQLVLFDEIF